MKEIKEIVGEEYADECLTNAYDMICSGSSYDDIEDMMLGYGLEMDYLLEMF